MLGVPCRTCQIGMRRLYCSLTGGLGNQLFQIAQGLALSKYYGSELVVDDGWYQGRRLRAETPRRFWLPFFQLDYRLPCPHERLLLNTVCFANKLQKRLRVQLLPIHYDRLPLSQTRLSRERKVFLQGCWQLFDYINPLRLQLKSQLRCKEGLFSRVHQHLSNTIASDVDSVFVHVRRGDYLSSKRAAVHGVCSVNYYTEAFAILRQHFDRPHVFLFSDDLPWALKHLPLDGINITSVDSSRHEDPNFADLADFQLMRLCRHAVIANSSFSWWAAFLLQTPCSVIIAPRMWYTWGTPNGLFDPSWLLI